MEHKVTVKVPRCWQTLVNVVLTDLPEYPKGGKERQEDNNGDPNPYYDDIRRIDGEFPNGFKFALELASGQSNYYGGLTIWDNKEGDEVYCESWEAFGPVADIVPVGKDTYRLNYEWIEACAA